MIDRFEHLYLDLSQLRMLAMLKRREFIGLLFCVACLGSVATSSSLAEEGEFSQHFLNELNVQCWSQQRAPQRRSQSSIRPLVRVNLRNTSDADQFHICVYDLTCDEVVFRGLIERRDRQSFQVCSDSKRRGHIVVLDAFENFSMFRDLRSRATIKLQYRQDHRSR